MNADGMEGFTSNRPLWKAGATISVFCAATLFQASFAHAEQLVIAGYGAEYERLIKENIVEPFKKEFGIDVVYDTPGVSAQQLARLKAMDGEPGYDILIMTAAESLSACSEGLLLPLTTAEVPNIAQLMPEVQDIVKDCAAIHEIQHLGLAYRTDKIDRPSSWLDILKPEYKGRVIMPWGWTILSINTLQMLAVAQGGDMNAPNDTTFKAYADGVAQADFAPETSSLIMKYLEDGSVWITPNWVGRVELLREAGTPVDIIIPDEGTTLLLATLNVPAKAANKEAATKFVNFWLDKTQQETWAQAYKVGTIRTDVDLPEEFRQRQITREADLEKLHIPDLRTIAEKRGEWEREYRRVAGGR